VESVNTFTNLPAIPEPSPTLTWAELERLVPAFLSWIETVDEIAVAEECRLRLAALEEYVERRGGDVGPVQTMTRTNERRIGDLLGPAEIGRPPNGKITGAGKLIHHARRNEFRQISEHWDIAEPLLPISREKLLMAIKRARERQADLDARDIEELTDAEQTGDRWVMIAGDFRDRLEALPDGSVDMIVTDPPYPADQAQLWSDLAEHAARLLRPQGILAALSGKIMLPDVIARLSEHLQYGWIYCQPLPGSTSRIVARHIGQSWKPWLAFSNGAWPSGRIEWHPDILDGSPRIKERYHWEQTTGPAVQIMHFLCPAGGLVLDPFAGSGTYGEAALVAGRRFLGVEADRDRYLSCCHRLEEAES
jgi:16S rRNA G966 N2-methylase RsmD